MLSSKLACAVAVGVVIAAQAAVAQITKDREAVPPWPLPGERALVRGPGSPGMVAGAAATPDAPWPGAPSVRVLLEDRSIPDQAPAALLARVSDELAQRRGEEVIRLSRARRSSGPRTKRSLALRR